MYRYSGTPLVRPPHLYQKCGLSIHLCLNLHFQRGWPHVRVASQKGFYCTYIDKDNDRRYSHSIIPDGSARHLGNEGHHILFLNTGLDVMPHALIMTIQSGSTVKITWDIASIVKPNKLDTFKWNQIHIKITGRHEIYPALCKNKNVYAF